MLAYYDLVKLVRPQGSGRRVGHVMLKELGSFLEPVLGSKSPIQIDVAARQLSEWSVHGSKLELLCAEFGPGCLFFLGDLLSPDL